LRYLLVDDGYTFEFIVRAATFSDRRKLIATAGNYHAVIVQRKLLDPSHARLLRRRANKIFFDLDDAVMVQRRKNFALVAMVEKIRRYLATARAADHIVAGNEYLASDFENWVATSRCCNCGRSIALPGEESRADCITRIGLDRIEIDVAVFATMDAAIESAEKKVPGLRLITIANDTVRSDVIKVEHQPWSEGTEAHSLQLGDIGIAPTPVDQWSVGKSGFKIIQYMATGLPTIASPVGANAQIITEGITGLLPESHEQWTDAIVKLANDYELRKTMGGAARKAVLNHYTLNRARAVWLNLMQTNEPRMNTDEHGLRVDCLIRVHRCSSVVPTLCLPTQFLGYT